MPGQITKLIDMDDCVYRLTLPLPVTMPQNSGILCADYATGQRVVLGVCARTNIIKAIMHEVNLIHEYKVNVPIAFTFLEFGSGSKYLRHTVSEAANALRMPLDILCKD